MIPSHFKVFLHLYFLSTFCNPGPPIFEKKKKKICHLYPWQGERESILAGTQDINMFIVMIPWVAMDEAMCLKPAAHVWNVIISLL